MSELKNNIARLLIDGSIISGLLTSIGKASREALILKEPRKEDKLLCQSKYLKIRLPS